MELRLARCRPGMRPAVAAVLLLRWRGGAAGAAGASAGVVEGALPRFREGDSFPLFFDFDCSQASETFAWDAFHGQIEAAALGGNLAELQARLPAILWWPQFEAVGRRGSPEEVLALFVAAETECPVGALMYHVLRFLAGAGPEQTPAAAAPSERRPSDPVARVDSLLRRVAWHYVAGSRWPVFEVLRLARGAVLPLAELTEDHCCPDFAGADILVDWPMVWRTVTDWQQNYTSLPRYTLNHGDRHCQIDNNDFVDKVFAEGWEFVERAYQECYCAMGWMVLTKIITTAAKFSACLQPWSKLLEVFLREMSFAVWVRSPWPIVTSLAHFADLSRGDRFFSYGGNLKQRRSFSDLRPFVSEALLPFGPSPLARRLIPTMQPPEFLPLFFERHPSAFLRETVAAISRAAHGGVLYYTLLYGPAFSGVLEKQVRWLERLGMTPLMVIALGEEGRRTCRRLQPLTECFDPTGGGNLIHRYTLPTLAVHLGISVFHFDLDVLFLRDPVGPVLAQAKAEGADMLWAGHLQGDCVNAGLFFIRATPETAHWLTLFVNWLHLHPYEMQQRGAQHFLDEHGSVRVSFRPKDVPTIRWRFLDDANEFVATTPGWLGDSARVVALHYMAQEISKKVDTLSPIYDSLLANPRHPAEAATADDPLVAASLMKHRLDHAPERGVCW